MDELVRRAMARWPNVPAVFGWLALDRRGEWRIRLSEADANEFERITSASLIGFIARNYEADSYGRYYFQNGPQRVFVALDYTPWVVRLSDDRSHLVTHTDARVQSLHDAWLDENGAMLVSFERGVAVVLDRDLDALTERVRTPAGAPLDGEWLVERVGAGDRIDIRLLDSKVSMACIASQEVPRRFGFIRQPGP